MMYEVYFYDTTANDEPTTHAAPDGLWSWGLYCDQFQKRYTHTIETADPEQKSFPWLG